MFKPLKEIRELKSSDFIGKMVTFDVIENDDNMNCYVVSRTRLLGDILLSSWIKNSILRKTSKFKRKIVGFGFTGGNNGGRINSQIYDSYQAYFNKDIKQELHRRWGDPMSIFNKGAPDQSDVVVQFSDFTIESHCYNFVYPAEWYSDYHKSNPLFDFSDGFYTSAKDALKKFIVASHDVFPNLVEEAEQILSEEA